MIQICYISTARPTVTPADVDAILAASRRNNQRLRVTGLLLFNGKRFLQLLEGPASAVEATYQRIAADPRHFALVRLSERAIDVREFGDWDMAFQRFAGALDPSELGTKVAELTRGASSNVKALFTSYAAL
jgi:hypothetical protein